MSRALKPVSTVPLHLSVEDPEPTLRTLGYIRFVDHLFVPMLGQHREISLDMRGVTALSLSGEWVQITHNTITHHFPLHRIERIMSVEDYRKMIEATHGG